MFSLAVCLHVCFYCLRLCEVLLAVFSLLGCLLTVAFGIYNDCVAGVWRRFLNLSFWCSVVCLLLFYCAVVLCWILHDTCWRFWLVCLIYEYCVLLLLDILTLLVWLIDFICWFWSLCLFSFVGLILRGFLDYLLMIEWFCVRLVFDFIFWDALMWVWCLFFGLFVFNIRFFVLIYCFDFVWLLCLLYLTICVYNFVWFVAKLWF